MSDRNTEMAGTGPDKRIVTSKGGVTIRSEHKPIQVAESGLGWVYLLLDCSASMYGVKLEQAKQGVIDFAKEANGRGHLTGLIGFGTHASHLCDPVKNVSFVRQAIRGVAAAGSTNMSAAIRIAADRLTSKCGSRVIVIATDGMPDSVPDALAEATKAKDAGIQIVTIGTDYADKGFLTQLASRPDMGKKVSSEQFGFTIISAAKMLPQLGPGQRER